MTPHNVLTSEDVVENFPGTNSAAECRQSTIEPTAVILAGVHRWGGNVLDRFGPRLLLPVGLHPLIEHGVQWLQKFGMQEICICANSDTSRIREHLNSHGAIGDSVRYSEDVMPRGPAGCVRDAAIDSKSDTIVVLEGGVIARFDLRKLIETHRREEAVMTIAVYAHSSTDGEEACRPLGVYVMSRSVLNDVSASGHQDLKEVLIPKIYERGQRIAVHTVSRDGAMRVLDVSSYLEANLSVALRAASAEYLMDGFIRHGDAWVHESAELNASARLMGAVIIGPKVEVEAEAMIVGPTVVGERCSVGQSAVISRSVLWDNCRVGGHVIVDHSLLTQHVSIMDADVVRNTVMCCCD